MGLVDYSDSDASDTEDSPAIKPASSFTKSTFQKVVDRSNPGKIRVTLLGTAQQAVDGEEPPAKRVKIGGSGFGGLNSFLPPPKRTGVTASSGHGGGSTAGKSDSSAGSSFKTGAEPGFIRETPEYREELRTEAITTSSRGLSLPPPKPSVELSQIPAKEVKLIGKPMMFKPLSVSRNPAKKKKAAATPTLKTEPAAGKIATESTVGNIASTPRAKVSLFSMGEETSETFEPSTGEYKPMIYGVGNEAKSTNSRDGLPDYDYTSYSSAPESAGSLPPAVTAQSLTDIASDLGLSAAEKRQLFGRQRGSGKGPVAHNVINFNTDQEYQHNNELLAQGETVSHNPVKSIAPGKHSLKQLLNAAQSQKEALEESFAKGRSNRAEASSRYGW